MAREKEHKREGKGMGLGREEEKGVNGNKFNET